MTGMQIEKFKLYQILFSKGDGWVWCLVMHFSDLTAQGCYAYHCYHDLKSIDKVRQITTYFDKHEECIRMIKFSTWNKELLRVGVHHLLGREEKFVIEENEELLGCEMHYSREKRIRGITWIKWKKL